MTDDEPVSIDVTIAAPAESVWPWLRDRERIGRWHGWLSEGLADEIDFIYFDHATESDEPYTLDLDDGDRFTLTEDNGVTTVRVTRGPRGRNPEWDAYYDDITEGWISFLAQLRFAVERQPERSRRTVFLATDEAGPRPQDALGLAELRPDEPYDLTTAPTATGPTATGSTATGERWFAAARQVGVTVDQLGPGLLIVCERPRMSARPDGGAMAILTAYGLDDQRFADVRDEWVAWWRATYPRSDEPQT
jgi:hypothetical protein